MKGVLGSGVGVQTEKIPILRRQIHFVKGSSESLKCGKLIPSSRYRLMKRQCSTKMHYEKTVLDSFEL